jgi:uncharacterized integral membrane protein
MSLLARILRWVFLPLIAIWVIVFAIWNHQSVEISLWPFPYIGIWPISILILLVFAVGFIMGRFTGWVESFYWKHHSKTQKKRMDRMEKEMAGTSPKMP